MVDQALIDEAGRRLAAAAPGARVIVFGSHARGDAGPRSDVDFLVVEAEVDRPYEESVRLMRELGDLRIPADVVVVSERYVHDWRDVPGGVVYAALTEGRVLAG